MKNDYWIISDIHGCYDTLMKLIEKLPGVDNLYFAGDLIDRGPQSKQVVEFAMDHKIPTVMGNHEHMALYAHGRVGSNLYDGPGIWRMNGGDKTLDSFGARRLPEKVLDWMGKLPYFIEFPDSDLVVSHTGHFNLKHNQEYSLWERSKGFRKDGRYRVFGHTQEKKPVITDTYAMIDTGCAYEGYGVLTAFNYPSKEIIQQKNIHG